MKILSVNTSHTKGTPKEPVEYITLTSEGIKGDAHAGRWHRQISLLPIESFPEMATSVHFSSSSCEKQAEARLQAIKETIYDSHGRAKYGIYAENITTEGSPSETIHSLKECTPGDRFTCGKVIMEVTQIGKKCHGDDCSVKQKVGACVMPTEGIFAKVIKGGVLKSGDELIYHPLIRKYAIITLSTRASEGVYPDISGPTLDKLMSDFCDNHHWQHTSKYILIPDDETLLQNSIEELIKDKYDFIFTTGGTGIGPCDVTSGVIRNMIDREIPGIMDYVRMKYGSENPNALISDSIAGIKDDTMIFALPGSVKAVTEYFTEISKCLKHLSYMRMGLDIH